MNVASTVASSLTDRAASTSLPMRALSGSERRAVQFLIRTGELRLPQGSVEGGELGEWSDWDSIGMGLELESEMTGSIGDSSRSTVSAALPTAVSATTTSGASGASLISAVSAVHPKRTALVYDIRAGKGANEKSLRTYTSQLVLFADGSPSELAKKPKPKLQKKKYGGASPSMVGSICDGSVEGTKSAGLDEASPPTLPSPFELLLARADACSLALRTHLPTHLLEKFFETMSQEKDI